MCDPSPGLGCLALSLAPGEAQSSLPPLVEGGWGSVGLLQGTAERRRCGYTSPSGREYVDHPAQGTSAGWAPRSTQFPRAGLDDFLGKVLHVRGL